MSRSEIDAAWDSAEYNAKRAELAEARVAELELALRYIDEQSFDARVIAKARAALEGKEAGG